MGKETTVSLHHGQSPASYSVGSVSFSSVMYGTDGANGSLSGSVVYFLVLLLP